MAAPQAAGYGAGAGLTSVVQEGPGRFRATFANGNSIPLVGQAGQNLYDRQQAAVALSQPRPAPGAAPDAVDTRAAAQPAKERVGKTVVSDAVGGQATPEDAEAAAQQPTGPTSLGYTMKGLDPATGKPVEGEAIRMPDGSVKIYQAARAGSPGGLTGLGKQTMQQYAEAQKMAAEHSAKAQEYQQVGVDLAVQDAEAHQAYLDEQRVQNQLQMQKQADEEAEIQKKVSGLEANYEKARQDFAQAKVDPTRIGKGGKNWLLGLSAALGAFGASLAKTPNFAADFINNRIADDIRAQETEINVKGRDADNQLATLTRSLGDLSLAKKAYRQLKLEEASIEGARVSNQFKGQEIGNSARIVSEQSAAEAIKAGEEKSRAFVEHVMKDKLYFRQGSAGTRGGFLTPTQESYQSARGSNIDVEKLKLQQNKAEAAAGKGPHLGQRAQGQIVAARNAGHVVNEMANSLGMAPNEQGELSDPSWGTVAQMHNPLSDTRQQVMGAMESYIDEVAKAQTGSVATKEAHDALKDQFDSAKTPGQLGAIFRHYHGMMRTVEKNVRDVAASSGPGSDSEREDDGTP